MEPVLPSIQLSQDETRAHSLSQRWVPCADEGGSGPGKGRASVYGTLAPAPLPASGFPLILGRSEAWACGTPPHPAGGAASRGLSYLEFRGSRAASIPRGSFTFLLRGTG